jgi:hypothetical protein
MGLVIPIGGFKYNVGIGYVAIPSDLDRDVYIRDCYKNYQVSLKTEDGGFLNRVPIPPDVLNFIEFPDKPNELGSCVVYNTDEQHQFAIIVNRFADRDQIGDGREHSFQLRRKYKDQYVELSGSSKEANINLLVNGGSVKGKFRLSVTDSDRAAEAVVDIGGTLNVSTTGKTTLETQGGFEVRTESDDDAASFSQSATENKFYGQKLILNDGDVPMVLGNALKKFLGNFISEVSKITVNGSPIANIIQIKALATQLDSILSKEGFLKK